MRIVYLAPGNSIHSHKWIKYFAESGDSVVWISLHPFAYEQMPGVEYIHMPKHRRDLTTIVQCAWDIGKKLRACKFDCLHIHSAAIYAVVGCLTFAKPVVITAWGSDVLLGKKDPIKRLLLKLVFKCAKLITCDAVHLKNEIQTLGVEKDKIRIINFGIDTRLFRPGNEPDGLRKKIGLDQQPVVISLRRFETLYDIPTLIRAVPAILHEVPQAHIALAGTGPEESALKKLCQELGVEDNVHFIGNIDNKMLAQVLVEADVYVSTSLSDAGIAASTAEAMSCGLPVVVTDSGENALWVNEAQNGYLVPCGGVDMLAEKIIALLKDPPLRQKVGLAARATIVERNDYSAEMQKMKRLYEETKG